MADSTDPTQGALSAPQGNFDTNPEQVAPVTPGSAMDPTQTPTGAAPNAPTTPAAAPTTPAAAPPQQGGFLSKVKQFGSNLVKNEGSDPTYNDEGKVDPQAAVNATPGTLFKHLLVGALTGLGAAASGRRGGGGSMLGGAGLGFAAAMGQSQEADDAARNRAIQAGQIQRQKQEQNNRNEEADSHKKEMATQMAETNNRTLMYSYQMQKMDQETQESMFAMGKQNADLALKDGTMVGGGPMDEEARQKYMADHPDAMHSTISYITGEKPVLQDNGQPVMVTKLDPFGQTVKGADGKPMSVPKMEYLTTVIQPPENHTITKADIADFTKNKVAGFDQGQVKEGQVLPGPQYLKARAMSFDNQYNQAKINGEVARTNEANTAATKFGLEIKDLKERKVVQDDWTNALSQAHGDLRQANDILWATKPQSAGKLYAAQESAIASQPQTEVTKNLDGTETTTTKSLGRIIMQPRIATPLPQDKMDQAVQQGQALLQSGKTMDDVKNGLLQHLSDGNTDLVLKAIAAKAAANPPAPTVQKSGATQLLSPVAPS